MKRQTVIVDRRSGWIRGVRKIHSPNCDERPRGSVPSLIVLHGISLPPGRFGGRWIDRLFSNELPALAHPFFAVIRELKVSTHVLIDRRGRLTQYVPFTRRAWHAGKSVYRGRSACNDFSIGIELEGTDHVPYRAAQYSALADVVRALRRAYPGVRRGDIVGHSEIAPGRKTDPGPSFDWKRLRRSLRGRPRCRSRGNSAP